MTLTELTNNGVKVARLAGNRDLNEKAVKAKMKSMRENGQLVPAIIVDASTAIKDGLKVVVLLLVKKSRMEITILFYWMPTTVTVPI